MQFNVVAAGDKEFLCIETPEEVKQLVAINGYDTVFSFIRKAHKDFDTEPRIHCDGIILGKYVDIASVLYIETPEPTGTRFYEHKDYGKGLPKDVTFEKYDNTLLESSDVDSFEPKDMIWGEPNRMLMYSANNFHSKYPFKVEEGERVVLVTFYAQSVDN